jgi:hypothetical protein
MIIIILLISIIISSCSNIVEKPADGQHRYEFLLGRAYSHYDSGEIYHIGNVVFINAIESDAVRQLIYAHHSICDHILKEGFNNSKLYLKKCMSTRFNYCPYDWKVLKKDFNHFNYMNQYYVDLTRGVNTLFLRQHYSDIDADCSLSDIINESIILVEPECDSLYINDSICIHHSSKLMMKDYIYGNSLKNSFIYDRDRQMVVAAVFKNDDSNKLIFSYNISEIIEISQEDFYYLWNARILSENDTLIGPSIYHEIEEDTYRDCYYPYYGIGFY